MEEIESLDVLKVLPFTQFGSSWEIVQNMFGGKEQYLQAVKELEGELYRVA
ncbi:MAG: type I restriction-modification enzyme R subunit C-terminal domain-containing protein [Abditibacteriaceae bacterium]